MKALSLLFATLFLASCTSDQATMLAEVISRWSPDTSRRTVFFISEDFNYTQRQMIRASYYTWFDAIWSSKNPSMLTLSQDLTASRTHQDTTWWRDGMNGIYKANEYDIQHESADEDSVILGITYSLIKKHERSKVAGGSYHQLEESDIFISGRTLGAGPEFFSFVLGHEVGHQVGAGHVYDNTEALMQPTVDAEMLEPGVTDYFTNFDNDLIHFIYAEKRHEDKYFDAEIPLSTERVRENSESTETFVLVTVFYENGNESFCVKSDYGDSFCNNEHSFIREITE